MKRYSSRWLRLMKKNKEVYGNNTFFLKNNIEYIDYKNVEVLNNFVNKQGQIVPAIFNKLTLRYQKKISRAIKRARQMALMPYNVVEQQNEWNNYSEQRPQSQSHRQSQK